MSMFNPFQLPIFSSSDGGSGGDAVADGPGSVLSLDVSSGAKTLTEADLEGVGSVVVAGATATVTVTIPSNLKRAILFDSTCDYPVTVSDGSTAVILYNEENTLIYSGADGLHDLATSSRDKILNVDLSTVSSHDFSDEELDGVTAISLTLIDYDDFMLETPVNPYDTVTLTFPDTTRKITLIPNDDRGCQIRKITATEYDTQALPVGYLVDIVVREGINWISMSRYPSGSDIDKVDVINAGIPGAGEALGMMNIWAGETVQFDFELFCRVAATDSAPSFSLVDQFGTTIPHELGQTSANGFYVMLDFATYPNGLTVDEATYPDGLQLWLLAPATPDATMADIRVKGTAYEYSG